MSKHRVTIELEFDVPTGKKVLNCDVYDYLGDLIDDESLDYSVSGGTEVYGVIDYRSLPIEDVGISAEYKREIEDE